MRACRRIRGTDQQHTAQKPHRQARVGHSGWSYLDAMPPSRAQILAASAGWVAVVLNIVPGLGAGYLYQRRWQAYWITSALAVAWFVSGSLLAQQADPIAEAQTQLVGVIGLLVLAAITAAEAGLAVKRARQDPAAS